MGTPWQQLAIRIQQSSLSFINVDCQNCHNRVIARIEVHLSEWILALPEILATSAELLG
jgi:hypothetical protein